MLGFTGPKTLCGAGLAQVRHRDCAEADKVDGVCPSNGFAQDCAEADKVDGVCPSNGFHQDCADADKVDGVCPSNGFSQGAGCTCKKVTKNGATKVVCKKGKAAVKACGCSCKKVGKAKKCKKGKMLGFTGKATLCGSGLAQTRDCADADKVDGVCPGNGFAEGAGCTCKKVTKAGATKVVCKKGKAAVKAC